MKTPHKVLALIVLICLSCTACDQQQGNDGDQSTGSDMVQDDNARAMQLSEQSPKEARSGQLAEAAGQDTIVDSRSILDNASANKNLVTFTALLHSADQVQHINGTGPYTVFAPDEAAFQALPRGTLEDLQKPENEERLQKLLGNHIITGKLMSDDLQDGAILKTSAGKQLKVSKRNGQIRINGALVKSPDGMSSNGVLHIINKVLVPAEEQ